MKSVLVMGGSYFIGKKLVEILLERNYEVYVLNRGTVEQEDSRVKQLVCDRNDQKKLQEVLADHTFDIVIDVSGLNKTQAKKLCKALSFKGLETFVFLSSSAVYDVNSLHSPFCEEDKINSNTYWFDYGANKIQAEYYYQDIFEETNVKLIIVRPPYVYGEYNYIQRESFIFHHVSEGLPVLVPHGNLKLQFIYVGDLANNIADLAEKVKSKIGVYNAGSITYVTAKEWVRACAKAAGKEADIIEYDYKTRGRKVKDFFPFHDYDNLLEVGKIKALSKCETSLAEGLEKAYQWYLREKDGIIFKEEILRTERKILKELGIE